MKVILTETIESLGIIGSEVEVAKGYARNYLLPQKKAMQATLSNRRIFDQQKVKVDLQIAKEKQMAEDMAKQLEGVVCTIAAKVSEADKLYGSVTARDVLDALEKQQIQVDKRMILMKEPIKNIGRFQIPIRVYNDVEPEITVEVVAE